MTQLDQASAAELRDALARLYENAPEGTDPRGYCVAGDVSDSMILEEVTARGLVPRILRSSGDATLATEVQQRGMRSLASLPIRCVRSLAQWVFARIAEESAPRPPFASEEERRAVIRSYSMRSELMREQNRAFVRLATGRHNGVPALVQNAIANATSRELTNGGESSGAFTAEILADMRAARPSADVVRAARAAGASPGGADGTEWSTTD